MERQSLAATLLVGLAWMVAPTSASAACSCECVNGQAVPLCESSLDIPPPCMRLCPMTPPAVKPLDPITLPPLGTDTCSMEQVYNADLGRYEWAEVCY